MHIPDGFLDSRVSMGLMGAAAAVLAYSFSKVKAAAFVLAPQFALALAGKRQGSFASQSKVLGRIIYLIGMAAAVIFLAQVFDFTLYPGVSGHLLGGAFAAISLGPFAGAAAMAFVLIVQAIFWGDGGILALGANLINLAVIGVFSGYYLYRGLKKFAPEWASIGLAAWLSVVLTASAYGIEAYLSGKAAVLPAMLKAHAVIGIAEGLVTIALVGLFRKLTAFNNIRTDFSSYANASADKYQ